MLIGNVGFGGLKAWSCPYFLSVGQNLVLSHGNLIHSSNNILLELAHDWARKRRVELP